MSGRVFYNTIKEKPLSVKSDQRKQRILFQSLWQRLCSCRDFPGGPEVKNLLCDAGDLGLDPWLGELGSYRSRSNYNKQAAATTCHIQNKKTFFFLRKTNRCSIENHTQITEINSLAVLSSGQITSGIRHVTQDTTYETKLQMKRAIRMIPFIWELSGCCYIWPSQCCGVGIAGINSILEVWKLNLRKYWWEILGCMAK